MRAESLGCLRQRAYFPSTILRVDLHGLKKDFVFIVKIPENSSVVDQFHRSWLHYKASSPRPLPHVSHVSKSRRIRM